MKTLFDADTANEIRTRLDRFTPANERKWGTMQSAQALTHCSASLEMALGEVLPRQMLIGRIVGRFVKPLALGDDAPMKRNSPTAKELVITEGREFEAELQRLRDLVDRLVAGGPSCCTSHPHVFFGPLKPDEWGVLMYKHLDHHLRQFGA